MKKKKTTLEFIKDKARFHAENNRIPHKLIIGSDMMSSLWSDMKQVKVIKKNKKGEVIESRLMTYEEFLAENKTLNVGYGVLDIIYDDKSPGKFAIKSRTEEELRVHSEKIAAKLPDNRVRDFQIAQAPEPKKEG